jgi:NADH-quinone oxidoreductase subunit H
MPSKIYDFSELTSHIHTYFTSVMPSGLVTVVEWVIIGVIYLLFFAVLGLLLVYVERKVCADFQQRLGPNRVGFRGLAQTIADFVKLLMKELITPKSVDKFLYNLAPFVVITVSFMAISAIPFGKGLQALDFDIGVFFVTSITSVGVIGVLLAGWASNNKYSLIGAMRSGAQIVSYELSVGLSLLTVIILTGSLKVSDIVMGQADGWWIWKGHVPAIIAFIIFIVAGTAETNRGPFDLAEAESELTAGFHTEYSGIKFAFFFLAEYVNLFLIAAIATVVFLGGWMPLHFGSWVGFNNIMDYLPSPIWFFMKVSGVIFLIMWFKWTFPRLRVDQILTLEWKYLLPINLVNILIMSFIAMMGWHL